MVKLVNYVTSLHASTGRSYIERMNDNKIECMIESKKYGKLVNLKGLYGKSKIISFVGNIGALQNPIIFIDLMDLFKKKGLNNFRFLLLKTCCNCLINIRQPP